MPALASIALTLSACVQSKLTPYAQPRRVLEEFTFMTDEAMASAASAFCAFMARVVEPMYAAQLLPEREPEE